VSIRHPKKRAFLAAYSEVANVTRAAQLAGIGRELHYDWKARDPEYAAAFALAVQVAGDALEDEAVRRAQIGVVDAIFQGGKQVGTRRRYSDTLLAFLLKGAKPEKYNTERHELSGPSQGPIHHAHAFDLSALSEEELAALERITSKATRPSGGGRGGTDAPQREKD
jgi:hypothetical protein